METQIVCGNALNFPAGHAVSRFHNFALWMQHIGTTGEAASHFTQGGMLTNEAVAVRTTRKATVTRHNLITCGTDECVEPLTGDIRNHTDAVARPAVNSRSRHGASEATANSGIIAGFHRAGLRQENPCDSRLKPPNLRRFLARVIAEKSGEPHAGRQEVAAEVLHALQLAQRVCAKCGNEAFALEPSPLLCGKCHAPMQTPESESERLARFIERHSKTLRGLAEK
jgi:ribosomal protein S27AE